MNAHQKSLLVAGKSTRRTMAGVTLIETLVGMALGLLVVMVITQVWGVFEGQRGRTASGSTAQETGLIAMTQLEQSIHNAGSGFNAGMFQCTQLNSAATGGSLIPTTTPAPTVIVNGTGSTGSDQIQLTWASNIGGSIETAALAGSSAGLLTLDNIKNFTAPAAANTCLAPAPPFPGDNQSHLVVCRRTANSQCYVAQVTAIDPALRTLSLDSSQANCPYNPTTNCLSAGTCPVVTGDVCFAVGSFVTDSYSVNANQQLQFQRFVNGIPSAAIILADNVVSLQAQYGVAPTGVPPANQQVNCWTDATAAGNPTCAGNWTPAGLTAAQVSRIKALRVVIVVRSPRLESAAVTGTCTTTGGIANNGPCAWRDSAANKAPQIDLSADANWQRYRYRAYQTMIPLRNVIWANI